MFISSYFILPSTKQLFLLVEIASPAKRVLSITVLFRHLYIILSRRCRNVARWHENCTAKWGLLTRGGMSTCRFSCGYNGYEGLIHGNRNDLQSALKLVMVSFYMTKITWGNVETSGASNFQ